MTLTSHTEAENEVRVSIPSSKDLENSSQIDNESQMESKPLAEINGSDLNINKSYEVSKKKVAEVFPEITKSTGYNPPDGGFRAWMIMIASFTINGIVFSIINSYSLIYIQLKNNLEASGGNQGAAVLAALVGSLSIGTTFFLSPIVGILTDEIGIQLTTFIGGALAFGGMLLSSFFSTQIEILCLTYGVMFGIGASLAYTPSLVILGHYFKRRLGLVNGIVTAGSPIFTVVMLSLIEALLKKYDLKYTFKVLAALTAIIMACALLFKPISVTEKTVDNMTYNQSKWRQFLEKLKSVVNTSIWKKKRYVVWASAISIGLFGYFVPYVQMSSFVLQVFGKEVDRKLPIMFIGIASGLGRLVFGYVADLPRVNRILLHQISFLSIGTLTLLLPWTPPHWWLLLTIVFFMGLFDGCFISLLGPIAFDICGREGASQAIGCLLGLCSIPLTGGPPIAEVIYGTQKSYTMAFILAGVTAIIGGISMFLVRCVKETPNPSDVAVEAAANDPLTDGKELDILRSNGTSTVSP